MSEKDKNMINTYRQQLMYLSQQKQQLQLQSNIMDNTIKELENTTEKKVYKGVGNVFILSDKDNVLKQTKDNKETIALKLKTVEKQEADTLKRLNELSKQDKSAPVADKNSEGIA